MRTGRGSLRIQPIFDLQDVMDRDFLRVLALVFGAMMSSSLLGLVQLAFAVTVGMLLDTFIVRTTLVPAVAALLDKWNWWPGRGPGK